MSEKIIGYILLTLGIIAIIYPAYNLYGVFAKKTKPVNYFNLSGVSLSLQDFLGEEMAGGSSPGPKKTAEIVKPELINEPFNLFSHIIFMGFIASVGLKLGTLGTQLVRPVKVTLKEEKPENKFV